MKKFILLIICFLFCQTFIWAYFNELQVRQLFPSTTRLVFQLNNNWDLITPDDTYSKITLPHLTTSKSRLIYQREFRIDKNILDKFSWNLVFLGIASDVEIYVNEQFVGKFSSNYLPFNVELSRKILTTNNLLKLILTPDLSSTNNFQNDIFAPELFRGIPRDIFLEARPQLSVSNISYSSKLNNVLNFATIDINFSVQSKDLDNLFKANATDSSINKISNINQFSYQIQLREKSSKLVIAQTDFLPFSIDPYREILLSNKLNVSNFKLWSLQSPNLYEIVCKLYSSGNLIDEFITNFAFRKFEIIKDKENPYFKLNEKKFVFKSIGFIENFVQQGKINLPSKFEEDFRQIKVLGANAIVFKYFYPNRYLLELCDQYGLLAFIDVPLYNLSQRFFTSENTLAHYTNQLKNAVNVYSSNPSVIGFGIGRGIDDFGENYGTFVARLSKIIKEKTDKITYKTVYPENKNSFNESFDFIFFQTFETREKFDKVSELFKSFKQQSLPLPVVLSFGVAIQNYNHEGYSNPFSVEYQGYLAGNLFRLATINDGNGVLFNNFNDYYSYYPILQTQYIDNKIVTNGLIDIYNKNKTSFATIKALFNDENPPLLDIGNFSNTVYTFILLSLLLIIIFLAIYSRFRRFQEYFIRALIRPYNFYADIRDQRILSPSLTYILGVIIALTFGIFFESLSYYFISSEKFQFLATIILPDLFIQIVFYKIIWFPIAGVTVFALIFIVKIYLIALIIRIFAYLTNRRINYFDVMNITIWGSLPIVFLLPFDLILFKLLQMNSFFFELVAIFAILLFLISILRIFKATAVVFDVRLQQVYLIGIAIISVIFLAIYLLYQSQAEILNMVSYFVSVLV